MRLFVTSPIIAFNISFFSPKIQLNLHVINITMELNQPEAMTRALCRFISGTDDLCLAMDGSERSYQLLGSFAAGQHLYSLDVDTDGIAYITFSLFQNHGSDISSRVKVPTLHATEKHLKACEYKC